MALNYHVLFFSYSGNGLNEPQNIFQKTGNLWWEQKPPLSLHKEACVSQMWSERDDDSLRVSGWLENEHDLFVLCLCLYETEGKISAQKFPAWLFLFLYQRILKGIPHLKPYASGNNSSLSGFLSEIKWRGLGSSWYPVKWWQYAERRNLHRGVLYLQDIPREENVRVRSLEKKNIALLKEYPVQIFQIFGRA